MARAVNALNSHPQWLLVYGEGEEFNEDTGLTQRYPTLPVTVGLSGFRSHCFICQPAVVFRRSMGVLLGEFNQEWRTAFDFDYWLRAFGPHRIGYIPHLQGRTRLHNDTITTRQRAQVALEATRLEALYFGEADGNRLNNYALELQLGLTHIADDVALIPHLRNLFDAARNSLSAVAFSHLETKWLSEEPPPLPQPENCAWYSEQVFQLDSPRVVPFLKRPYGVNLIGHAFEIFGVGEDLRMAARAFQAADIPFCVIHYPAANGASCADRSLEPFICSDPLGGPYAFNLICMTAPMQARWLREQGTCSLA